MEGQSSLRAKVLQQLQEDIQIAQSLYDSPEATIQDITFDGDSTVSFKFILPTLKTVECALCIPDNYPKEELTLVGGLTEEGDLKMFDASDLKGVFSKIVDEYWTAEAKLKRSGGKNPIKGKTKMRASKNSDSDISDEEMSDLDGDGWVDDNESIVGSEWSSGGDPFQSIDEEEAAVVWNKLTQDIDAVRKQFGNCGVYSDPVTREYLVRLSVDTGFLDRWTADAWGVDPTLPIVAEILFTWQYLNGSRMPPKVISIVQSRSKDLSSKVLGDTHDFGLQWYLNNRLSDVLRRNWVKYYRTSNDDNFKVIPLDSLKKFSTPTATKTTKGKEKNQPKEPETKYTKEAYHLLDMGFQQRAVCLALNSTQGNVEEAVQILMDPSRIKDLELEFAGGGRKQNKLARSRDLGFAAMSHNQIEKLENFFDGPNFLAKVVEYLSVRTKTCASSCVICDGALGYQGLKPTVCTKPLCTHSFDSYGLGFSLTSELEHNADVVDLLVTITVAAAKNRRHNGADVFEPFPDAVNIVRKDKWGREEEELSFRSGKTKNFDLVAQVCDSLPSIDEMKQYTDEGALKAYLDELNPLCYPLLRWILMSNRAHLAPLPKNKHIKEMGTPYQYVLVSDNPQKEANFRRVRAANGKGKKGSFYAFHGSAIGNWHSIFRQGLKNYSNTDKMSAGAACGPGIYMAADASTSFGYMVAGQGWQKSRLGNSGVACIALCEVIDYRGQSKGVNVFGGIYTVTDETLAVTRYFFIYPSGSSSSSSCAADRLSLPEDIYS